MDTYRRAALATGLFGIGANITTKVFDMDPLTKSLVGGGGIALMVIAVGIVVYPAVRRRFGLSRQGQLQEQIQLWSVIGKLIERKQWAMRNLLHAEVPTERDVGRWQSQYEEWRKEVIGLLLKVCSPAEVSRFDDVGLFSPVNIIDRSDKLPIRDISLLHRDLEVLLPIIDRLEKQANYHR
jgi:hypothetical protein